MKYKELILGVLSLIIAGLGIFNVVDFQVAVQVVLLLLGIEGVSLGSDKAKRE